MWLGQKKPKLFFKKERIIRHVYSPHNINIKTRKLKSNFLQFVYNPATQKNELSCNRFELETLYHSRRVGKQHAIPPKREYFGFACTNVLIIKQNDNYSLFYSPVLKNRIWNYTHSDIYDNGRPPIPKGEALSAEMQLEREKFLKNWSAYFDNEPLIKKNYVNPPNIS